MRNNKMTIMKKIALIMTAAIMAASLTACGKADNSKAPSDSTNKSETSKGEAFPKFEGKDFEGNTVDNSLFTKNEATLLNFWFNGCSACVNEMPALEKFNEKLREKGAELIGVNVQATESEESLNEAKNILSKQGVTYRNIMIGDDQEASSYLKTIFSFPTTVIVDKNGNIVGSQIVGAIDDEEKMEEILKIIDDIKAGKDVSDTKLSGSDAPQSPEDEKKAALYAEEQSIFGEHKAVWDKLFSKMSKDKVQENKQMSYVDSLKSQIEESKDSFSEEELKTLNEDLKKIEEIENKIQELEKAN